MLRFKTQAEQSEYERGQTDTEEYLATTTDMTGDMAKLGKAAMNALEHYDRYESGEEYYPHLEEVPTLRAYYQGRLSRLD